MRKSQLASHLASLAALMLLCAACADSGAGTASRADAGGDNGTPDGGNGDGGGDGGNDAGNDDTGNDDTGNDDTGNDDTGNDDTGNDDTGNDDTGLEDLSNDDEGIGGDLGGGDCPLEISGVNFPDTYGDGLGGTHQVRLIIEAVSFVSNTVWIRNVSGETGMARNINFDNTWRIVINGASGFSLAAAPTLSSGDRLRIHVTDDGFNDSDDLYLGIGSVDMFACGGDVTIQHEPNIDQLGGWSGRPENVEGYVRWGVRRTPGQGSSFNDEAFDAGAWEFDYNNFDESPVFVCWEFDHNASLCGAIGDAPICEGGGRSDDDGLLATGAVNSPSGWSRVAAGDGADCF